MTDYETQRLEKIKRNRALIEELGIKPNAPTSYAANPIKPATKKRKISTQRAQPSKVSRRIASSINLPSYNDDTYNDDIVEFRSHQKQPNAHKLKASKHESKSEPISITKRDVDALRASWSAWSPVAKAPTRDANDGSYHFSTHPTFMPNKSPEELIREGSFGGSYWRPLYSKFLHTTIENDWHELPESWTQGLKVEAYLTSPVYDVEVNKYKVKSGQSIEDWEAAGWIRHEYDVRGWFQWYCRFFQGRRCEDDDRQVQRWENCVGIRGRWRRLLLKKYQQMGVKDVFDDGEDDDTKEVSPVMHQTCHHWAFEVRQPHLDEYWQSE